MIVFYICETQANFWFDNGISSHIKNTEKELFLFDACKAGNKGSNLVFTFCYEDIGHDFNETNFQQSERT